MPGIVERMVSGPSLAAVAVPIWAGGRTFRVGDLGGACVGGVADRRERGVGADADALFRVAANPGGVVALSPLRFWSPSARSISIEKGLWAPPVFPAEAAWKLGLKGLVAPGQGEPPGPESSVKNWLDVSSRERSVPWGETYS